MSGQRNGELLTVDQAAERLNVPVSYVRRRLVFEQRIPYVKIGRHLRIDSVDLEQFIAKGRVGAAVERSPFTSPSPRGASA